MTWIEQIITIYIFQDTIYIFLDQCIGISSDIHITWYVCMKRDIWSR